MIRRVLYLRLAFPELFQRKLRRCVAEKRHRFLESKLVSSASFCGRLRQLIFPRNYIVATSFCSALLPLADAFAQSGIALIYLFRVGGG